MSETKESKKLKVCWLSAGVSSFIAGWIAKDTTDKYIYIDIDDQHADSMRFIKDCEKALGKTVEIIKSKQYRSVDEAVRGIGCFKMPSQFAPCTAWLKKRVRKQWEFEHSDFEITYVWGMDLNEKHRANRLEQTMIEFNHEFPLIEKQLTKEDAHGMLAELGIKRPAMYELGYNNNNCIGCIKGGMGYWNKIRKDFPAVFETRAKTERELGASILKECYLDELEPTRGRMSEEIMPECSIFCMMQMNGENT